MHIQLAKGLELNLSDPSIQADGVRVWLGAESGAGKTHAAMLICEQLVANDVQLVVLDAHGEYGALWEAKPGRITRFGYGSPPVREESVELCLQRVREEQSLLLDLSHWTDLHPERLDAFMRELLRGLYELRRREPRLTFLLIEEAHTFCLPHDTEVLTRSGWKFRKELLLGEEVVNFDIKTATYYWGPIERIHDRTYRGSMVHIETNNIDCLMTPDHRAVIQRTQRGAPTRYKRYPWTLVSARDIPSNAYIPFGGVPEGPGLKNLSLEDMRILGWALTDGGMHSARTRAVVITQASNSKKMGVRVADEMRRVLERRGAYVGTRHRTHDGVHSASNTFYLPVRLSSFFLKFFKDGILPLKAQRRIPREVLNAASTAQLKALWQGIVEGDGSGSTTVRYISSGTCKGLADDIQEVALRLGIVSVVKPHTTTTNGKKSHQWIVCPRTAKSVPASTGRHRPKKVPFVGAVWDITVPSGAFVARRNGKTFVTGNCPQQQMSGQAENIRIATGIVTGGRKFGLNFILTTQRQSLVDSNIIAGCNVRFFGRISELKDWKKLKGYLPAKLASFGDGKKSDMRQFQSGEWLALSRWWAPKRVRFSRSTIQPKKFL